MAPRVLITGAAGGIGRALASKFTDSGYEVIATGRSLNALRDVPCDQRLELDVTHPDSIAAAVEAASRIDVLVNNAGVGAGGPAEHVPMDAARRLFEVNFFGAARMIQAVAPQMKARNSGVVVAISSKSACVPWPLGGYYAASKAALDSLHESIALELGRFGVRAIIVHPGVVDTAFSETFASYGADAAEYQPLALAWGRQFEGVHLPPGIVADAVVAAVRTSTQPLARLPVGEDVEEVLQMRATSTTAEFVSWFTRRQGLAAELVFANAGTVGGNS